MLRRRNIDSGGILTAKPFSEEVLMPWATNNWVSVAVFGTILGEKWSTEYTYRTTPNPATGTDVHDLATFWLTDVVPAMVGLAHGGTQFNMIKAWNRSLTVPPAVLGVSLTGTFTTTPADYPTSGLSFGIYKTVGDTFKADDDSPETGRPITRGYLFSPGLSDDWMINGLIDIPAAGVTPLSDLYAALTDTVVTTNTTMEPIVIGEPLPAIVPPKTPKPARVDEVYAPITEVNLQKISYNSNRAGQFS